jgi:hypothetical protein
MLCQHIATPDLSGFGNSVICRWQNHVIRPGAADYVRVTSISIDRLWNGAVSDATVADLELPDAWRFIASVNGPVPLYESDVTGGTVIRADRPQSHADAPADGNENTLQIWDTVCQV